MPNMGGGGGMGVIQSSAPLSPKAGSLWSDTDANTLFRRSDDDTAWLDISGEINKFTSTSTFTPIEQTGEITLLLDVTSMTAGSLVVSVDGSDTITLTSGSTVRMVSPSSSLAIKAAPATNMGDFTYASKSFNVSSQENLPATCTFKPDGTKFYVVGEQNCTVYQYDLSSAWDLSTASYSSKNKDITTPLGGGTPQPTGIQFKSDGSKCLVVERNNETVYEFAIGTDWDISTLNTTATDSFSLASQTSNPRDIWVSSDGEKFYVLSSDNPDTVYQYSLSSAWDLTTASYASKSYNVSSQVDTGTGLSFNSDGTKMYVLDNVPDDVFQYSLSTAYDVSTASYDNSALDVSSQDNSPLGLFVDIAENRVFVGGLQNDTVYQYEGGSFAGTAYATVL
jgi:sugar lactone lactonase YvrE